ncbi:MAG: hypothetical protein J6S85_03050 [Methanobrevibacter sp.]|nr:hypothetical protein [Methanobrevibacter sp.]
MSKELTKEELKKCMKNERNVFLNGFFDLLNQRKELEQKVELLQEQLKEANELISLLFPLSMNKERAIERATEYMEKWGVK